MSQYIVAKGDTLSAIARKLGVPINQISGYRSGNPNLIYPGEKLTIGESPAGLSGLGGTLKAGEEEALTTTKTLPIIKEDNLSTFQGLLKKVSEKYGRESMATGMEAGMGALEASPEQISGRSLAGIVDFIKGQKTTGIADIYKNTIDMLKETQDRTEKQLSILINTGAIAELKDQQLAQLSNFSGVDLEYLISIKEAKLKERGAPKDFVVVTEGGRKVRVGFDEMGNILSRVDIGSSDTDGGSTLFSREQRLKLGQAGIDWATPEGKKEALDFLYGAKSPDFEGAKVILEANKDKSDEEVKNLLLEKREELNLEVTDINGLIATRPKAAFSLDKFRAQINNSITGLKNIGYSKKEAKNAVINKITEGKDVLPMIYRDIIEDEITKIYRR